MIETLTDLTTDRFATIGTLRRDGWFYSFPADELRWFRTEREAGRIISALRRQDDGVTVLVAKMAKAPANKAPERQLPGERKPLEYRWLTAEEREAIRRLCAEGKTHTEIGALIGRSSQTVGTAVRKMAAASV